MIIQDQIAADKAAISAAESVLAAAKDQLARNEAILASVQPHLTALQEIESFGAYLEEGMRQSFASAVSRAKDLY